MIAPAGSGKTRVLTERARHLLTRGGCRPSAVCLVAFNKRAQEEMSARVRRSRRSAGAHAQCHRAGDRQRLDTFRPAADTLTTITELDVRRIIGRLVEFPRKRNSDPVALWIEALSLRSLGCAIRPRSRRCTTATSTGSRQCCPDIARELAAARSVDYDEQIVRAIEILLTDTSARAAAQRACRVLLVDEFQDLTPAHLLLVRLLAGPDGCVFGVGDDDQTIYGFNGADPQWLIDFAKYFPHAGDHPLAGQLPLSGRCRRGCNVCREHNLRRVEKEICAGFVGYGDDVALWATPCAIRSDRHSSDLRRIDESDRSLDVGQFVVCSHPGRTGVAVL